MFRLASSLAVLVVLAGVGQVDADNIPGVFSTGVDDLGELLTVGDDDSHYMITVAPPPVLAPCPAKAAIVHPLYVPNTSTSQWINPTGDTNDCVPHGWYYYTMTFDLTGFIPTTARIEGSWATDNNGGIHLNDVFTGFEVFNNEHEDHLSDFTITSGFQQGVNTLEFRTFNVYSAYFPPEGNPEGLQVNITSATADIIPEPSSPALLCIGAVGLLFCGRRRRRRG